MKVITTVKNTVESLTTYEMRHKDFVEWLRLKNVQVAEGTTVRVYTESSELDFEGHEENGVVYVELTTYSETTTQTPEKI